MLLGNLESPQDNSYRSGIGVISGWHCDAEVVEVVIAGTTVETAYGTVREDTQDICGDTDNGWGVLYNWNRFGDGLHTVEAYADGVLFASANVKVTTFGQEFMSGVSGNFILEDFLSPGVDAEIEWQQAKQNFQIVDPQFKTAGSTSNFGIGALENPQDSAGQSGVGIIGGWNCEAEEIIIEIDGVAIEAGVHTIREDTLEACGDMNNGFGVLYNWNRFAEGTHLAVAYADGEAFASANFTTTNLGFEFLTGADGVWELPNFPELGTTTHIMWVEEIQNLVIYDVD